MNILQMLKESISTIYAKYLNKEEMEFLPIYYIGGSQTLPPPLSPEEEEELLIKLNDKNPEVIKQTRQSLVERNLRLVVYIAKKFENTGVGIEDLISIGTIGLMKAINTFNTDKNIKLATYASRCIDNEILMYLRKTKRRRSEVSFEDSLSFDAEGNELHLEDVLGTESDIVTKGLEDETNKELLKSEIDKLNDRDREIIELRYGLNGKEELTQKEVADLLGISQSYISRIEKKVIKKLGATIK